MSRVAAAVAFTGGATACFFIAGAPAQAVADADTESDSTATEGPSAIGGTDSLESKSSDAPASETGIDSDDEGDRPSTRSGTRKTAKSDSDAADAADEKDAATSDDDTEVGDDDASDTDPPTSAGPDPAPDGSADLPKGTYSADSAGHEGADADTSVSDVDAPAPSDPESAGAEEKASDDDEKPPATFAALARAVADAGPENPSFFTWIQRTFFNETPTVWGEPEAVEVRSDGSVTGVIVADDADGDVLTYSATALAAGATVTISGDGSFVYRPAAGSVFDGGDLFSVEVSDDADENGWHVHGLLGLLVPGFGSTATTTVELGAVTAAGRYGWGTPRETRFSGPSALNGWVVYDSVGHNGWGRRTPRAISFVDGVMVITGDAAGNTGGLTWGGGQKYGAWEVRMRVPEGAVDYHAVALLWPDAENWPVGGEVDFVEVVADATRQTVSHHLHYSALDLTEAGVTKVDATEWHNYAVSWTPSAITIYVDGVPVWKTTDTSHFPPGPMHLALQLDASEKHPPNLSAGAQMAVAWARQYSLSQIT